MLKVKCNRNSNAMKITDGNGMDLTEIMQIKRARLDFAPNEAVTMTMEVYIDQVDVDVDEEMVKTERPG